MERKRMIEVGIAAAVLVALALVLWLMMRNTAKPQAVQPVEDTASLPITHSTKSTTTIDPATVPQVQEVSAGTVARTFVERIGSYSSESDYQNIDDVSGLVTAELATKLQKDADKARASAPADGGYYGISTSYIGAKNTQESDTSITLLVQTQREESFGSPANATVRYQTITVTLVKESSDWKVSAYTWGD